MLYEVLSVVDTARHEPSDLRLRDLGLPTGGSLGHRVSGIFEPRPTSSEGQLQGK